MLIRLSQGQIGGIAPRLDPKKLADSLAQTAQDVNLAGETLAPYRGLTTVQDLTPEDGPPIIYNSLYSYRPSTGQEWLYWEEEDISVVENPVASDVYERIYWTGASDGKLKVRGTFGTQDVGFTEPSNAPTISLADKIDIDYSSGYWSGLVTIYDSADVSISSASLILDAVERTDVGYSVTFTMPTITVTGSTEANPKMEFKATVDGAGLPGTGTIIFRPSTIGTKWELTVAAADSPIARMECTQIDASTNATQSDGGGGTYDYVWDSRQVTFTINMNYWMQREATYYYLYTTVDSLGQESSPSPVSDAVLRDAEDEATISMGSSGTTKRLYRSANSSDITSGFYFVGETSSASYVDWIRDEDLVEELSIHDNPVDGMDNLVVMPGGFALASKGKTLYASEQYLLYSWLPEYEINFDSNIKALSVAGNECLVLTDNKQYLVTGDTPETLVSSRLMLNQTCETSNRGVAVVGRETFYPSPDGYVSVYGGQGQVATEALIQPRDWANYNPDTFIAESYNKKLYACSDNTFFVMDLDSGIKALTTLSYSVTGLHYDSVDDILYAIVGYNIVSIDTNESTYDNLIWRSKDFDTLKPWRPACIRVEASDYPTVNPITIKLYADGALVYTHTVTKETATKIPKLRKETSWYYEVESPQEIYDIQISTSIGELQ